MFQFTKNCSTLGLVLHRVTSNVIEPNIRTITQSSKLYSSKFKEVDYNNLKADNSSILHYEKTNMPVEMENPYVKEKQKCILCKHKITPDYRNTRLLSQFVSRFTDVYTVDTSPVYVKLNKFVWKLKSQNLTKQVGLFPTYYRDPRFAHDPMLYDPDHPFRPHRH